MTTSDSVSSDLGIEVYCGRLGWCEIDGIPFTIIVLLTDVILAVTNITLDIDRDVSVSGRIIEVTNPLVIGVEWKIEYPVCTHEMHNAWSNGRYRS